MKPSRSTEEQIIGILRGKRSVKRKRQPDHALPSVA